MQRHVRQLQSDVSERRVVRERGRRHPIVSVPRGFDRAEVRPARRPIAVSVRPLSKRGRLRRRQLGRLVICVPVHGRLHRRRLQSAGRRRWWRRRWRPVTRRRHRPGCLSEHVWVHCPRLSRMEVFEPDVQGRRRLWWRRGPVVPHDAGEVIGLAPMSTSMQATAATAPGSPILGP